MKKYLKYKDSSIEWIGVIPEHWDRIRIKSLVSTKVTDGPHETPEWKSEGIPFISAEAIKGNQIDLNYQRGYISIEQHQEYCKKSKVEKGDMILLATDGLTGCVEDEDIKNIIKQDKDIKERFCIDSFFSMIKENQYKIQYRVMLSRYRGKTVCPICHGTRLRKEASYVKICGRNISDLVEMPIIQLADWFNKIELDEHDKNISKRLLLEIKSRLKIIK